MPEDITKLIESHLGGLYHDFPNLILKTAAELLARAKNRAEWKDTATFDAARVLLLISETDDVAKRTIRSHSRQYWYFLIRRMPRRFWVDEGILVTAG